MGRENEIFKERKRGKMKAEEDDFDFDLFFKLFICFKVGGHFGPHIWTFGIWALEVGPQLLLGWTYLC